MDSLGVTIHLSHRIGATAHGATPMRRKASRQGGVETELPMVRWQLLCGDKAPEATFSMPRSLVGLLTTVHSL